MARMSKQSPGGGWLGVASDALSLSDRQQAFQIPRTRFRLLGACGPGGFSCAEYLACVRLENSQKICFNDAHFMRVILTWWNIR